ncbi:MAG: hypothetical protein HRT71_13180 [Flavobacteriales bacterium]|nr:hypothetical protein [Flavobacteriales bacterium]
MKLPFDKFKALIDKNNKKFTDDELKKLRDYLYIILRIDLDLFYSKRAKRAQSDNDETEYSEAS